MERLQKKCMVGSLMTHCALVGVLSLAAAFTKNETFKPITQEKPLPSIPINVIPQELIDGLTHIGGGGGKPAAAPKKEEPKQEPVAQPPPVASVSQPLPEPTAPPKTEKPVETPKAEKPVEKPVVDPLKLPEKPKKPIKRAPEKNKLKDDGKNETKPESKEPKKPDTKVKVNLDAITRDNNENINRQKQLAAAQRLREERAEQAAAAQRERLSNTFSNIGKGLDTLKSSLASGSVAIIEGTGPGSGGPGSGQTFVNYAQWVKEIYDRNWTVSDSVIGDDGIVRVEIVVQRNGTARGKIIKSSGNAALDRTVKAAIDRVSNIGYPFPEGSTDNTRTFIINFNLSSKRQTG
jgi:TonB family protein